MRSFWPPRGGSFSRACPRPFARLGGAEGPSRRSAKGAGVGRPVPAGHANDDETAGLYAPKGIAIPIAPLHRPSGCFSNEYRQQPLGMKGSRVKDARLLGEIWKETEGLTLVS